MCSGRAAQLTSTHGRARRGEPSCTARAISSLPTPVSPVISTAASLRAILRVSRITSRMVSLAIKTVQPSRHKSSVSGCEGVSGIAEPAGQVQSPRSPYRPFGRISGGRWDILSQIEGHPPSALPHMDLEGSRPVALGQTCPPRRRVKHHPTMLVFRKLGLYYQVASPVLSIPARHSHRSS